MNGKWLLHGQRPYWWVKENKAAADISLQQTQLTCETGPGVPSGHSQAAAVIWFCLADAISPTLGRFSWVVWLIFFGMQILMGLSRVFIAAHFPHQCILGFIVGLVIVKKFYI